MLTRRAGIRFANVQDLRRPLVAVGTLVAPPVSHAARRGPCGRRDQRRPNAGPRELARSIGYRVELTPLDGPDGICNPNTRLITIESTLAANAQVAAPIDELAHALRRTDQQSNDPPLTYPQEELVVESGAWSGVPRSQTTEIAILEHPHRAPQPAVTRAQLVRQTAPLSRAGSCYSPRRLAVRGTVELNPGARTGAPPSNRRSPGGIGQVLHRHLQRSRARPRPFQRFAKRLRQSLATLKPLPQVGNALLGRDSSTVGRSAGRTSFACRAPAEQGLVDMYVQSSTQRLSRRESAVHLADAHSSRHGLRTQRRHLAHGHASLLVHASLNDDELV